MADTAKWAERIAAWRASGLTSTAFCEGRDFTAGGLRHWDYRLRRQQEQTESARAAAKEAAQPTPKAAASAPVRLARVVRKASAAPALVPSAGHPEVSLVLEVAGARVRVGPGFCSRTLGALLDVLEARTTGGRR
jgi:hypothetical protein